MPPAIMYLNIPFFTWVDPFHKFREYLIVHNVMVLREESNVGPSLAFIIQQGSSKLLEKVKKMR